VGDNPPPLRRAPGRGKVIPCDRVGLPRRGQLPALLAAGSSSGQSPKD